jgi:hypothetical protein
MRVLLVHGLGRTPLSLLGLAWSLYQAGHHPELIGYIGALETYPDIVGRVRRRLRRAAARPEPYAAVGHSLGGLVLRAALDGWPAGLPLPRCLLTLGTPHSSPRLARRFQGLRLYRWLNGECGQLLARPEFFAGLPPPPVPVTAVAGTRGWPPALSLLGPEPNDGIVAVEETRLGAGTPLVELPVSHTFMMHNRRVRALVREVLSGAAPSAGQSPEA